MGIYVYEYIYMCNIIKKKKMFFNLKDEKESSCGRERSACTSGYVFPLFNGIYVCVCIGTVRR